MHFFIEQVNFISVAAKLASRRSKQLFAFKPLSSKIFSCCKTRQRARQVAFGFQAVPFPDLQQLPSPLPRPIAPDWQSSSSAVAMFFSSSSLSRRSLVFVVASIVASIVASFVSECITIYMSLSLSLWPLFTLQYLCLSLSLASDIGYTKAGISFTQYFQYKYKYFTNTVYIRSVLGYLITHSYYTVAQAKYQKCSKARWRIIVGRNE